MIPLPVGKKIAIIGPHAMVRVLLQAFFISILPDLYFNDCSQAAAAFLGNYLGQICPDNTMSCVTALNASIAAANVGGTTLVALGCKINSTDASGIPAAVALAEVRCFNSSSTHFCLVHKRAVNVDRPPILSFLHLA